MPQSLALVSVHITLSTKNRSAFLQSPDLRSELPAYLIGTLRARDGEPLRVGGVADHVHILAGLSRSISLAELVKNLKNSSTKIVNYKGHSHFSWQSGYGAFSVRQSAKESVIAYIASPGKSPSQNDIPGTVFDLEGCSPLQPRQKNLAPPASPRLETSRLPGPDLDQGFDCRSCD